MRKLVVYLLPFAFLLFSNIAFGGLASNTITGSNPNISNPYTEGQVVSLNLAFSGIGRGVGINGTSANDRYNANSWNTSTIDLDAYFNFTLTPAPGFLMSFVEFEYTGQRSPTGPDSFAFRSSLDNFTANLGTPTATGATISLSDAVFQNLSTPVEFRLYGWNTTNSGGTFSVNDFSFEGTISAVPEPSSLLLCSLFAMSALGLRRRR